MKFSTLEGREDLGLTMSTWLKKTLNCEVRKVVSWPLKTLEMKVPPGRMVLRQISRAATSSWDWTYWSMSWKPVTGEQRRTVWSPVAHHELCLVAAEAVEDLLDGLFFGDVSLDGHDAFDRSDLLQVDRDDSGVLLETGDGCLLEAFGCQPLRDELRPAAGSCADVDDSLDSFEDVVHLIDVHQLVGASRAETVFLRLSVVDVLDVSHLRFSNKCEILVPSCLL